MAQNSFWPAESLPSVDISTPNAARIYDYLLGGSHNFAVDRETAERAMAAGQVTSLPARLNRSFLRRAVRFMLDQGIDQFLDLGSGIPTVGNVHEIAQAANPAARIVYVDNEPVAVAHARQILADNPNAVAINADLRDVDAVLGAAGAQRLLDFTRPVGVLLVSVLHFIPEDDRPGELIRRYLADAAAGSYLAVSHYTEDGYTTAKRELAERGKAAYQRTGTLPVARGRTDLARLLAGLDLVPPGIVWTPEWRPDGGDPELAAAADAEIYGAVARVTR
ncbi:MAG TPA: SAM-dependent methyltransferase [Pseudonocardiaceae bacterium]|jgi:hypothetical protein|nr:SAM-dependent methyltransferase [Pseudonocardiaceae bacterium]